MVSRSLAVVLAVLSGAAHAAAGPPLGWWPVSFVALVPLCVAVAGRRPIQAAGIGWLAGFVAVAIGFFWLAKTLESFTSLPRSVIAGAALGFDLYHGGRWALFAWLFVKLVRHGPLLAVFLAHVTAELLYPMVFPWQLGSVLHDVPLLLQSAEIGGALAVSGVIVLVNGALLAALLTMAWKAKGRRRLAVCGYVALSLVVPVVAAGLGAIRLKQVDALVAGAPKSRVGLVQPNAEAGGDRDATRALRAQLSLAEDLLAKEKLDLLIWSESAVPGGEHERHAARSFERSFTRRLQVPLLFGAVVARSSESGSASQLNSAFLAGKTGTICKGCRYDKQLLLPFGEYLPGERWFPRLREWWPHTGTFVPGPRAGALELEGKRMAVTICYEDLHAEHVGGLVEDGARLLVNLTDDAWFHGHAASSWHLALAKLRAVEQRRFLVRATNSGMTAVVDSAGRVVIEAPAAVPAAVSGQVSWLEGRTVFSHIGQAPWWLLAMATLATIAMQWAKDGGRWFGFARSSVRR